MSRLTEEEKQRILDRYAIDELVAELDLTVEDLLEFLDEDYWWNRKSRLDI